MSRLAFFLSGSESRSSDVRRTTLADLSCRDLGPPTKRCIRKGQDIASLSDTKVAWRANSCRLEDVSLVLLAVRVIPRHTDPRHGLTRRQERSRLDQRTGAEASRSS